MRIVPPAGMSEVPSRGRVHTGPAAVTAVSSARRVSETSSRFRYHRQGSRWEAATTGRSVLFTPVEERLAWSSLGFHAAFAGLAPCEHATLPEDPRLPARSVETRRRLSEFDCVFVSIAWELEVVELVRALRVSGVEPARALRSPTHPLVVAGGPLTLANPGALSGIADAVFVGEADAWFQALREAVEDARDREDALARLARVPGVLVPAIHGEDADAPDPVRAPLERLPVASVAPARPNVFGDAFLVEVGRGCPRACTFCVVRNAARPTSFVEPDRILARIPARACRVGLVGAAVSDHPGLARILDAVVSRGARVTLSSIRADRVNAELARRLAAGGLKTLTVAADGASEALRDRLRKGIRAERLLQCARLARTAGIRDLRVYLMVGLPDETEADLREGAALIRSLSAILPATVSVSPFVPKRWTPLGGAPFAGVTVLKRRIGLLRRLVGGEVRLAIASPRIAEREWRLAHASGQEALALALRWSSLRDLEPRQARSSRSRSSSSSPK